MTKPRLDPSHAPGDAHEHKHFIEREIDADLAAGKNEGRVQTRFPPEPNGYLHIGHAKAICISFGLAKAYAGKCNLRFDDTNPTKEEVEYVHSIQDDIRWLGFEWDRLTFTSGFFEDLYGFAEELIRKGLAYVDDQTVDEIRANRGTPDVPGTSPYRDRSVEENLDLFQRMRKGEFEDGARVLRAKIDMASPNFNLRDPVLYRILHATHHRTGDDWCIYPMYDWAHGQCDALEGITHSLCSLEFENHRPLYDWFLDHVSVPHRPRQIEFARLNLTYAVMSKRKLLQLVQDGCVSGWDDPRMLTISGLRRRGYTPESIVNFCSTIGVAKFNSTVDMVVLENSLRDDLNKKAQRRFAVLHPLAVEITNLAEGESIPCPAVNNPEDPSAGERTLHLTRKLWIEQDDFREDAPRKFFRLKPDGEVRLRYGFVIRCDEVVKDENGDVVLLRCTYDPESGGGKTPEGKKKVKGIIHWVSADDAVDAEVRLYDHLFAVPDPSDVPEGGDFKDHLNASSLEVLEGCKLEPSLAAAVHGEPIQFERLGYFCADAKDSRAGALVFNRSVSLRVGT